jgi:ubiquinone/menaquinone biosynthesis C-methylase UbiE
MLVLADGILNLEFAKVLSQGKGSIHGIDSSASMIDASKKLCKDFPNATFEGAFCIHSPGYIYTVSSFH